MNAPGFYKAYNNVNKLSHCLAASVLRCPPSSPSRNTPLFMDKNAAIQQRPPIENAADYIDALLRPRSPEQAVKRKFIEGRRMRDKFLDSVSVPEEVVKPLG